MAQRSPATHRGYSTGQVPNLPQWENATTPEERRMRIHASKANKSADEMYMNAKALDRQPRVGKSGEVDVYQNIYSCRIDK